MTPPAKGAKGYKRVRWLKTAYFIGFRNGQVWKVACKKLAIRCKRFEDGKKAGVGRLETVLVVLGRFAMVMDGIGAQVRGRDLQSCGQFRQGLSKS